MPTSASVEFDPAALDAYLRRTIPGLQGRLRLQRIGGGQSNPTFFVDYDNYALAALASAQAGAAGGAEPVELHEDELALLVYTSGTTGHDLRALHGPDAAGAHLGRGTDEPCHGHHGRVVCSAAQRGGTPMPPATIAELLRKLPGLQLMNCYGAMESMPVAIMPADEAAAHPGRLGRLVPCAEVAVMDVRGCELPAGGQGELWIMGPSMVPGYWNNDEATARSFTSGFWRSGVRAFGRRGLGHP